MIPHPHRPFIRQVGTYHHRMISMWTDEPCGPVYKDPLGQCQVCGRLYVNRHNWWSPADMDQPAGAFRLWTADDYTLRCLRIPRLQRLWCKAPPARPTPNSDGLATFLTWGEVMYGVTRDTREFQVRQGDQTVTLPLADLADAVDRLRIHVGPEIGR